MNAATDPVVRTADPVRRSTIAKNTCLAMGVVFLIVAIWGYIDGDNVLIFHVNAVHNTVHLLSGIAAIACGLASEHVARMFCWIFGVTYGLVALLGFAGVAPVVNLLHLNPADNWLHVAITLVFLLAAAASMSAARPALGTRRRPDAPPVRENAHTPDTAHR